MALKLDSVQTIRHNLPRVTSNSSQMKGWYAPNLSRKKVSDISQTKLSSVFIVYLLVWDIPEITETVITELE